MAVTAIQRNDLLRVQYSIDISVFSSHPEFFVFVDEMGSNERDQKCKFTYNMKGSTPTVCRFSTFFSEIASLRTLIRRTW